MWILNPFNEAFFQKAEKVTISEKERLIELSTDSSLESEFKKRNLIDFWVAVKEEYQELGVKAIKYLIPFTNTELVERAFSSYTYIKNKYRNKLDAAPDIKSYLSSFQPNFIKLTSMKQAQGSH
ncbi:Zinc finger BED domain-containing protein 5 [Araneus ventricosus]|uniref:Zinc finger BED domain-containing protein 5 n=1 Tax=Araneus ventricosus TaxID=182803 RepID=A0A4Y2W4Z3_ARAVE|nr:Zinc finger BED domain-containing protein 5 [Araneus ventricosus]